MSKKKTTSGVPPSLKMECRTSVVHQGRTHKPGTLIEVPEDVAEELEDGGFAERVYDVVVTPPEVKTPHESEGNGLLAGDVTEGNADQNTEPANAES
ncbi:MAG: hypothetical protein FD177_2394 [Desulfovibrionaceae bacterium]|nr:MAG: hypothetical protein FD177_2394 [Desulfovibrionaceae bacterium]